MDMATRQTGLKFAAAVTVGFGLLTAAAAYVPLQGPTLLLADLLIWPMDGLQTGDNDVTRLMFAIGGGVLAGWGMLMWMLATEGMAQMPDLARRMIITSALTWFVVDSTASILADAPWNVLGNLPFLVMFLWPLRKWNAAVARA
jgi:hypothetical protein